MLTKFWGLPFLLWSFWPLWAAAIGLLWMILAYSMTRQAAIAYGDLWNQLLICTECHCMT